MSTPPGLRPITAITTRPARLLVLVGGATLLTSINFSLIFVAFTEIGETMGGAPSTVQWALTGFSITAASLWVPAGWMTDRFGRERVFLWGLILFTVGSGVVAWSPNVGVLIGGRVVQAMGLALESSAALPILLHAFPVDKRATVVGSLGATGGVAAAIGPVIGGALVDNIGWRSTFALNVPIGVLLCGFVLWKLPFSQPRAAGSPPDALGVACLAGGMGSLVLAITQVNPWGFTNGLTAVSFGTAIVLLCVVVLRSMRHSDPVLYLPLFRDVSFRRGVVLNFLIAGTFAGTFFAFIRLLTVGWGLSTYRAGLAVAVIPLLGGPLSFLAGRIADRHGPRWVIVPGATLIAIAGLWFSLAVSQHRDIAGLWLPVAAIYGMGVGFAHAACQGAALRNVEAERLGIGGSMSRLAMDIGGIITVAVAVSLVTSAQDAVAGVRRFTLLVSIVAVIGALYAVRLDNRQSKS